MQAQGLAKAFEKAFKASKSSQNLKKAPLFRKTWNKFCMKIAQNWNRVIKNCSETMQM